MTTRERFMDTMGIIESEMYRFKSVDQLDAWIACEKQVQPPRPTTLPKGWRVKGDEPVMVMPGERFPPAWWYPSSHHTYVFQSENDCNAWQMPMFVWELEEVKE